MRILKGVLPSLVLGLVLALAVPQGADAQLKSCGFCLTDGPGATCEAGTETSLLLCEGVFLGFLCVGCEIAVMELPSNIRPDGTLDMGPERTMTPEVMRALGHEIAPGVYAARAECNDGLTHVWYEPQAEQDVRRSLYQITL